MVKSLLGYQALLIILGGCPSEDNHVRADKTSRDFPAKQHDFSKWRLSELIAMVHHEMPQISQQAVDDCLDADEPRDRLMELVVSSHTTSQPVARNVPPKVSACRHGTVPIGEDRLTANSVCEAVHDPVGRSTGISIAWSEKVPMLLKQFDDPLQKQLPWLREYILEREQEWLKLPARCDATGSVL